MNQKTLFQDYEDLRTKFNNLAEKHNALLSERKILMGDKQKLAFALRESKEDYALLDKYVGKLIRNITEGWPRVLKSFGDSIDILNPPGLELIFLKLLLGYYDKLIAESEHERNDEISLMYLLGLCTYKYIHSSNMSEAAAMEVLELVVPYLNSHAEYGKCEQHGITKHFDERFHICDTDVEPMEKVQMMGFVVMDLTNGVILKKANTVR